MADFQTGTLYRIKVKFSKRSLLLYEVFVCINTVEKFPSDTICCPHTLHTLRDHEAFSENATTVCFRACKDTISRADLSRHVGPVCFEVRCGRRVLYTISLSALLQLNLTRCSNINLEYCHRGSRRAKRLNISEQQMCTARLRGFAE